VNRGPFYPFLHFLYLLPFNWCSFLGNLGRRIVLLHHLIPFAPHHTSEWSLRETESHAHFKESSRIFCEEGGASRRQYPNQHSFSNYLAVPREKSQELLWDCIWVPLTPPLPTRTNPTPRVSAQTTTGRETSSIVTQPPRPSTTNQRLAERMVIFASAVGDTWPVTNSSGI